MKKAIDARGISLIEIIFAMLILSIGLGFSIRVFSSGRFFLNTAENKAKAMRIASVQMEKYLAKSYAGLEDLIQAGKTSSSWVDPQDARFQGIVTLTDKEEVNAAAVPQIRIPYIVVDVAVTYTEERVGGGTDTKVVRIANLIPYPYFHVQSLSCNFSGACSNDPAECAAACPPVATAADTIVATLKLTHKTRKNLLIMYNIGIQGVSGTGIDPNDILETQCYFNGAPLPIRTGTPIMSQPFISNILAVQDVSPYDPASPQYITLRWSTASPGVVQLKWVNLIVLEVES